MGQSRRERTILRLLPMVRTIAHRVHRRVPRTVDFGDLQAAGVLGLIAAVDARRRLPKWSEAYCAVRIRGAILDELRRQDWIGRRTRAQLAAERLPVPEVILLENLNGYDHEGGHGPE